MDIHSLQLILLTSFTIKCKFYVFPYVLIISQKIQYYQNIFSKYKWVMCAMKAKNVLSFKYKNIINKQALLC